jgi:hypoxanthine-DNA glycosylase
MRSSSFEPAAIAGAKVLVVGTLPGQESIRRGEYYAHPRNAFWRIIEKLFGIPRDAEYGERVRQLNAAGVALWDVCAAAHRPGSLDASIRFETPNDFAKFLTAYPSIKFIYFNGAKAGILFRRHVALPSAVVELVDLPSTSPANAGVSFDEKLKHWSAIKVACES